MGPVIAVVSRRSSPVLVPGPLPFDLIPSGKDADAAARQLGNLLQELRERAARATDPALQAIEGEIQAVNDELLSLEYRGQLRANTPRLLSQVQPGLKEGLNQGPGQTRLEVHHTVPYRDPGAEKAREMLQKWGLSVRDPADAAIVPDTYHKGENVHGMADGGYNRRVIQWVRDADEDATVEAAKGGRKAGRAVMLEALRLRSDKLVDSSHDLRAIDLERVLRTLGKAAAAS